MLFTKGPISYQAHTRAPRLAGLFSFTYFLHKWNYKMLLSFPPDCYLCYPSSVWCIKMMTMAALRGGVAVDVHCLISGCGSFINISWGSFLLQQDACREWDRGSGLSPPPHSQSLVLFLPAVPPAHLHRPPPPSLLPSSSQTAREMARKAQRVMASAARVTWCVRAHILRSITSSSSCVSRRVLFLQMKQAPWNVCVQGVWVLKSKGQGFRDSLGRACLSRPVPAKYTLCNKVKWSSLKSLSWTVELFKCKATEDCYFGPFCSFSWSGTSFAIPNLDCCHCTNILPTCLKTWMD